MEAILTEINDSLSDNNWAQNFPSERKHPQVMDKFITTDEQGWEPQQVKDRAPPAKVWSPFSSGPARSAAGRGRGAPGHIGWGWGYGCPSTSLQEPKASSSQGSRKHAQPGKKDTQKEGQQAPRFRDEFKGSQVAPSRTSASLNSQRAHKAYDGHSLASSVGVSTPLCLYF